jgi:transcriptional regulator with XRE-family HTH domain
MIGGDLPREARRRAGLSQAELTRRAGKPTSVIGRWERGEPMLAAVEAERAHYVIIRGTAAVIRGATHLTREREHQG